MMEQPYSKWITIRKAATTGLSFLVAFIAGVQMIEFPEDVSEFEKAAPGIAFAVIMAGIKAWNNVRKNGAKPGGPGDPFKHFSGYAIVFFALALTGCATNGITVSETTPDGGVLKVEQKTMTTWGAKTQEGAGNFLYSATADDGSSFDMRAGAGVVGQEAADPVQSLTALIQALAGAMAPKAAP